MSRLGSIAAALLMLSAVVPAYARGIHGAIDGRVVDASAAVLPDVTITLRQAAIGLERTVVTDATGTFRAPLLPVGIYELTATRPGYAGRNFADLRLTLGRTITLHIEMQVAELANAVTVSGTAPAIETSRSHASALIDESAIWTLPLNGRNFIDFLLLTPGVTRDTRSGDFSFAGQRGAFNGLVVDGAENFAFDGQVLSRMGPGRAPYQFSQEAVQELQVSSNAYSAEYGRAGVAVVNVVTRTGTNEFHGSIFDFYRDTALNATHPINGLNGLPKSPYHYHQFGGTVGGPLRANRNFFFFDYEGQRNRQPNAVFLNLPPNTSDDAQTQAGIERLRALGLPWTRGLDQDVFLMRTDHALTSGHRATIRYSHQDFRGVNFEHGGPQNSLEHTGDSILRTRTLTGSWAGALRSGLFNELRLHYAHDDERGDANSDNPEAVISEDGAPVLMIGRNSFSPRRNTSRRVQVADTITLARGAHTIKAGVDIQLDDIAYYFPRLFGGSYAFRSLASFAGGRPTSPDEFYRQNFAGPGTSGPETRTEMREHSLFVQDAWQPGAGLTLNVGLRYDLLTAAASRNRNPDPQLAAANIDTSHVPVDADNWGPRVGVAWAPHGQQAVVRAAWGMFYGRTPAAVVTNAQGTNGVNVLALTFTGDAVPAYPERFATIPVEAVVARPNIFFVDKDHTSPQWIHGNLAFEWELSRGTSLSLTYLRIDGTRLPRSMDRNLGTQTVRTFTVAETGAQVSYPFFLGDRPFENFQRVVAFESSAESHYHGFTVELNRRFQHDLQLRASYTLGRVEDTVPEATAVLPGGIDDAKFPPDPVNDGVNRAAGNHDQRQRLVVSGVLISDRFSAGFDGFARSLAGGWLVSGIFVAQSGLPYSARVTGVDLNGDGNIHNDLAPGFARNSFRLPSVITFDMRVARDLPIAGATRLQLIWETFNLFNRDNIDAVVPAYYDVSGSSLTRNPNFQRPFSSAGERIMQLAARISF